MDQGYASMEGDAPSSPRTLFLKVRW